MCAAFIFRPALLILSERSEVMLKMENYTLTTHCISVDTFLLLYQTQMYVVNLFRVSHFI